MNRRFIVFFSIALSLIFSFSPLRVFAIDEDYFASNDILFYNPDDCNTSSTSVAGKDTINNPDKEFGTGPVTPGEGHNWKPGVATEFGGSSEDQPTSFGHGSVSMDNAGVYYFAILPKDYKNGDSTLPMNPNTPKEIQDAVKSGKLNPKDKNKNKLLIKKGDKVALAAWLDVGPGAAGDGRWIDLGMTLSKYIGLGGLGPIEWDFPGGSDVQTTSGATSANKSSIELDKDDNLTKIYKTLTDGGMNAVQASAVMGNMYAESGFKSDAVEAGNGEGYGLAQWSFNRKTALFSFTESKGVAHSDVQGQLEFLLKEYKETYKANLTDFNTGKEVTAATKDWMEKFEAPAKVPANDPAALNTKRIPAAQKVYELFNGVSDATGNGGCSNTSTGNGAVAGDIVTTALNYALKTPATNGMNQESDANPAFLEAIKKYNPGAPVADCGAFVATVMKSSVDKDYPSIGTMAQLEYVTSKPDKYQIIRSPIVSDLQPGDVLVVNNGSAHHTMIYTGQTPYPAVDASQDQRVPSVRPDASVDYILRQSGVIAARIKK